MIRVSIYYQAMSTNAEFYGFVAGVVIGALFLPFLLDYFEYRNKCKNEKSATMRVMPRDNVITFFYPGNQASMTQACIYTGGIRTHEEQAYCPGSPPLLHNLYDYPSPPEIIESTTSNPLNYITELVSRMRGLYKGHCHDKGHAIDFRKMNVGGKLDVDHHQKHLLKLLDSPVVTSGKKKVVLFGCSRGAATTLISASKLSQEHRKRIAFVLLEAPFDTLPSVLAKTTWFSGFVQWALGYFGSYSPTQETPLDAVRSFPLDLPVAFVASQADRTVPQECTVTLYRILKDLGHKHLHIVYLKNAPHSTMPIDNPDDTRRYLALSTMLHSRYAPVSS